MPTAAAGDEDAPAPSGQTPDILDVKAAAVSALRLIRRAIASAGEQATEGGGKKRQLFESGQLLLTVSLSERAKGSAPSLLLTLPHSVHCPARDSGCLITKDLNRAPEDYEATSGHYAELLRRAGCQEGLTVLPLRELTVAYMPYEAKRRLCHAYDYFLADRRVCHRLGNKLGAYFLTKNRRKLPIPVNLEARGLADEIDQARRTVRICLTGSTVSCLVGRIEDQGSPSEDKELLENVASACEQVLKRLPNVYGMYLRHPSCGNVPLFVGKSSAPVEAKDTVEAKPKKRDAWKINVEKDLAELGETLWDKELLGKQSQQFQQRREKADLKRQASGKIVKQRKAKAEVKRKSVGKIVKQKQAKPEVRQKSAVGKSAKQKKQKKPVPLKQKKLAQKQKD